MSSVIGVDLGGTKVAVALLRGREFGDSLLQPDRSVGERDALIDQLVAMVRQDPRATTSTAVGIGVPSIVEFETGTVVSSVNIPLEDVPLRQVLGERLGVPVFVDNDATVAALAEAHDEELRLVARNLVMITVGTGVGGGIVLGGRIYRGATGGAGELGHTLVGLDLAGIVGARPRPASRSRVARVRGRRASARPARAAGRAATAGLGARAAAGARASRVLGRRCGPGRRGRATRPPADHRDAGPSASGSASPTRSTRSTPRRSSSAAARRAPASCCSRPAKRVALGYVVPGSAGARASASPGTACAPGVLGAALLAAHESRSSPAAARRRPPAEQQSLVSPEEVSGSCPSE